MKFFVCWTWKEFGHFSSRYPKRLRKNRKNVLSNKVEEFRKSMERSLKDSVDESRLVKEEQVSEETTLVAIIKSTNVIIDDKFRLQEIIVDYNLDDDDVTKLINDELFVGFDEIQLHSSPKSPT